MARKNSNLDQIIRKDGNNCFVEVMSSSFGINRVLMHFVSYDPNRSVGDKFTADIPIYLTFEQFLRFAYEALDSHSLTKRLMMEKQQAEASRRYPTPITITMGGTNAETLNARGKNRPDNMSESRVLKIFAGNKLPIMFIAEKGAGQADAKGLIVPRYGNSPDQKVSMGLKAEDFEELILMTRAEINAFLAAKKMYQMLHPEENTHNNFEGQSSNAQNNTQNNTQNIPSYQKPRNYRSGNQYPQNRNPQPTSYDQESVRNVLFGNSSPAPLFTPPVASKPQTAPQAPPMAPQPQMTPQASPMAPQPQMTPQASPMAPQPQMAPQVPPMAPQPQTAPNTTPMENAFDMFGAPNYPDFDSGDDPFGMI